MSQANQHKLNSSNMSEQNQAEVKTSHAIEEFTRNLGSTTLKFLYHNRHQLRFTIHGNKVEVLPKDGEEFVFATYKMAVAVDRAAVAVAVATVNYETAKARREPRSVRVRLLLARLTAVEEAIKAFRAFNIALGPPEDSTEQHDIIANCGT
ncbi:hypothetical protein GGX14DRAFT_553662 [Mycena pura]|uniref:Uncharacterized protein n=1 Tax=Mycena pura TaxID=153505 RepID=A0AAD7E6B5_9AGAR|nr:hypothetical protein GGX14DRAFT_573094 [Mycena pura]KAJ7230181.1 hypothetical protein GGX14DRAFT_553662 [Mycena pura]